MQIEKRQTAQIAPWRKDGYEYKGTVFYGMHYIQGNHQPYFSITGETFRRKNGRGRWTDDSGGCLHELIARKKPKLKELIQFHLIAQDGLPMHYVENAWYWYQGARGWTKTHLGQYQEWNQQEERATNWNAFCRLVLLEEGEKLPRVKVKQDLVKWLESRLPRLKERFDATMTKFGVKYITQEEIEERLKKGY